MATYVELIRQDVYLHEPCEDLSSWPSSVSEFVQSLKNELKLPRWLKSVSLRTLRMQAAHFASHKDPVPYTNKRVIDLLDQLRASDDASSVDLWDSADTIIDKDMERRQHVVFNSALVDCARIRAVIEAENLTGTPFPKESFLVILVRNAILDAHARLSSLYVCPRLRRLCATPCTVHSGRMSQWFFHDISAERQSRF